MATGTGNTGQNYSYSQLRQLWIFAGGNKTWSYVMAAIALAESGGNPQATNMDADGSVDRGLWQINSVHGYSPQSSFSPQQNAKQAVAVFNSSGPNAWSTFKNGTYKNYLPSGKSTPSSLPNSLTDPVPGASFLRIDQGVDYTAKTPVQAIASGVIESIQSGFGAGEGVASPTEIVERFTHPVTIGANTYYGGYYAEEKPLVTKGQKVSAGDPVMAAGTNEIGFLVGQNLNLPPLVGGLGAGTQPTQPGKDYAGIVTALGGPTAPGETNPAQAILNAINVASTDPVTKAADSVVKAAKNSLFGGIEGLVYQGFFILIGIGLVVVGLGLIAWTLMGRVGAPGIIGMAQQQMRINQAAERTAESSRASQVRESQATARLGGQGEQREIQRQRLAVQERHVARREREPTNVIYPVQERVARNRGSMR